MLYAQDCGRELIDDRVRLKGEAVGAARLNLNSARCYTSNVWAKRCGRRKTKHQGLELSCAQDTPGCRAEMDPD